MNHDTRSLRTASLIAGLALALMAVLAASAISWPSSLSLRLETRQNRNRHL